LLFFAISPVVFSPISFAFLCKLINTPLHYNFLFLYLKTVYLYPRFREMFWQNIKSFITSLRKKSELIEVDFNKIKINKD